MAQAITPVQEVKNSLIRMENEFKNVLPSYISPEKFMQVVVTAVQLKPELLSLDRPSLYSSCLACASDGLIPDGREAALVPYKGKIAYQPMVGGLLKLIRNSGELATVDAQTYFENDSYESYTDERGPHFRHVKSRGDRGKPILTYAYAITKDGAVYHEEITDEEIRKIEACSKTKEVWGGPFRDEQYRKSAIKRLAKRLPKSTDIERVIERDNEEYDLSGAESRAEEMASKTNSSALRDVIKCDEAQVVPTKTAEVAPPSPTGPRIDEPAPAASKIIEGLITDKKSKPFVQNGVAKNKYGCEIDKKWYGTFDDKVYANIEAFMKDRVLVKMEYSANPVTKDGKSTIYYNIVTLKPVTADDVAWANDIPIDDTKI